MLNERKRKRQRKELNKGYRSNGTLFEKQMGNGMASQQQAISGHSNANTLLD